MSDNLTPRERARNTVDEHFRVLTYAELVESIAAAIEAAVADYRTLLAKTLADSDNLRDEAVTARSELYRFKDGCARCGSSGPKAENTIWCAECLEWWREEWGQHSPCAQESLLTEELQAAKREIALLTDKLIAAGNAKADAKERLMEISGIDSGSAEDEAREKIQKIGYAETLRRVGDCGKWSLSWESVSNILELLQEGIISRRKAHESLNSVLHGEALNLPPLENCAFDDVELPGETVRQLRRSAFELSNDYDMAQGKCDQAVEAMHAAQAQAAEMRRALGALSDECVDGVTDDGYPELKQGIHHEVWTSARAALSITPGEALAKHDERVRREATIAALEALPCWFSKAKEMDCIIADVSFEPQWCPRCRALADARKGGA